MLLVVSLAGVLLAQAAAPAAATPAPTVAAVEVKPKKPKKICTDSAPMGSIISKRVCRTPEEVTADRRKAEAVIDTIREQR